MILVLPVPYLVWAPNRSTSTAHARTHGHAKSCRTVPNPLLTYSITCFKFLYYYVYHLLQEFLHVPTGIVGLGIEKGLLVPNLLEVHHSSLDPDHRYLVL